MTAEEIYRKMLFDAMRKDESYSYYTDERLQNHINLFLAIGNDLDIVVSSMKEYARQACAEQRRICGQSAILSWQHSGDYSISAAVDRNSITNAPAPELK